MTSARRVAFTLIELLVVIGILAMLIALLLPLLNHIRRVSLEAKMRSEQAVATMPPTPAYESPPSSTAPRAAPARIESFVAKIDLTPRLSIGMADSQSIYECVFRAACLARSAENDAAQTCLELPLPPQVISLSDLTVSVDGASSESSRIEDGKLVWVGTLSNTAPTKIDVTYTAMGRGIYTLHGPSGTIVDRYTIDLTTNGSDIRMLDLSMQPTGLTRSSRGTNYIWDYRRLMFGRPIALDVLGIAPIDRLGELSWLGPLSVVAFGLIVGFVARAYRVVAFDRWMLILVLGTFTAAYPLMYFAQQLVPLSGAIAGATAIVLLILTVRSVSLMGLRLGLIGVAIPAALILALTLEAAIHPQMQGILLTASALGLFIVAMTLGPRIRQRSSLELSAQTA